LQRDRQRVPASVAPAAGWLRCLLAAWLLGAPASWGAEPPPRVAAVPGSGSPAEQTGSPPAEEDLDDLAIILTNWTRVSAAVQSLEGEFTRHEFDSAHQTETIAVGRIRYEARGRALYAASPAPPGSLKPSPRRGPTGAPYQTQSAPPETLYWVFGQFARVDDARREYELFEIPPQFQSTQPANVLDSWDILWTKLGCLPRRIPGLLETDLASLQTRFDWKLVTMDEQQIVLTGIPQTAAERRHYSVVHVQLDPATYFARNIKWVDSTGTRETLHRLEKLRFNQPADPAQRDWAPDLARMNLLTAPPLAPPAAIDP